MSKKKSHVCSYMSHISHKVNPQNILSRKVIKKENNWLLHFQLYRKLVKVKVVWVVWGKKSYKEKSYIREKVEKDCKRRGYIVKFIFVT